MPKIYVSKHVFYHRNTGLEHVFIFSFLWVRLTFEPFFIFWRFFHPNSLFNWLLTSSALLCSSLLFCPLPSSAVLPWALQDKGKLASLIFASSTIEMRHFTLGHQFQSCLKTVSLFLCQWLGWAQFCLGLELAAGLSLILVSDIRCDQNNFRGKR